ncbi:DNA repair protein [Hymenopellis radicata]|nr:DNA repair protein [Hymenopellis radicata]
MPAPSGSQSTDYFSDDDPAFLEALEHVILPGEPGAPSDDKRPSSPLWDRSPQEDRKRPREDDEDIYGVAHFGDFGEYMQRKRAKLQIQNSTFESAGTDLFSGLAIYINGWTSPSVQVLRELIVSHGGVFQPYLVNKGLVTHILTCSLTPAKIREFQNMKVVRPEWLVDSAAQGVLLPWQDFIYTLPDRTDATQGRKARQDSSLYTPDLPSTTPSYASHDSNPFAQRAMAKPEWRNAHTSVAPDFIQGYYKNSRLHHLSTWKAELKDLVQEAQARAETAEAAGTVAAEEDAATAGGVSMRGVEFVMRSPTKGKGKAKEMPEDRVIMHCDFDCFFVSAGLLKRPELKGKPVVVCHSQGAQGGGGSTSEIASCSYEAREFGIKNGMSLQQARKLCPTILTMPYEFELYKQLSLQFYTVLMSHAEDLQAVSVDEALIEVTNTVNRLRAKAKITVDPAKEFAETIRAQVKRATGCEVSIGISHNILLARLATRKAKPAGSYHLMEVDAQAFIATLTISDLHGFGRSTKEKAVEKLGTACLGELANKSRAALCDALGKATGDTLYNAIRGIDDKKLESDKPRKSVSCEINYGIRFESNEQAEVFVRQMATEVKKRLDDARMLGRSITLKVMKRDPTAPVEPPKFLGHGACEVFNKQGPLADPSGRATNDETVIGDHAWRMLKAFAFDPKELRGLGIQIQKLESKNGIAPAGQRTLPFHATAGTVKRFPLIDQNPPPPPEPTKLTLPAYSQLDQSVYQALPSDVRQELDQEYKKRSESPYITGRRRRRPINPHMPFNRSRSRTNNLFPVRGLHGVNVKRITNQLAPSRAGVSPKKKTNFFGKQRGQGVTARLRMSDEDLKKLDLDPEVFWMLPTSIQREQLTRARLLNSEGGIPEVTGEWLGLRPRARLYSLDGITRRPPPHAMYPAPVLLRQRGKEKGEKLAFTETDDVQRIIGEWVGRFTKVAPNDKDVKFFEKFLVGCVNSDGGVGPESAVAVVKWWLVLLRRNWREYEHVDVDVAEGDEEAMRRKVVGDAWWRAFREVKMNMDVAARIKLGFRLSFK